MNSGHNFTLPSKLDGERAILIPLNESHTAELYETAKDESLWVHYIFRKIGNIDKFKTFVDYSIKEMEAGREFTFTIIDKMKNKMIGGTSFLDISSESRSLEIGRTWVAKYLQGTGFNAECKYMLLKHCFEEMKLIRVFFKTDSNNIRSQKALEKIGAKYEGILRNHMIREDGTFRHSAYFSVIIEEWLDVKKHLESLTQN